MFHKSFHDKLTDLIITAVLVLLAAAVVLPLFRVLAVSFVSTGEIAENPTMIWPKQPTVEAYKTLLKTGSDLIDGYKITLFRVLVGTLINLLGSYFVGFALARKELPGRAGITFYFFLTMLFGGGLIPTYIVVKNTGLVNNIWVYIIPGIISVWNMLLIRNFIMGIPESLFESARIDGAGELTVIFRIVLPLSTAALATVGLFYAVGHWNSWWDAYIYINKEELYPIQMILRNILAQASVKLESVVTAARFLQGRAEAPPQALQNAAVIVTTLPILVLYPFLQKYFVKGVIVGAIKG
jgi:putative aldouronate transport system permease protein